ncbi:putative quinol monooxygenase [Levilactobacillus parabrevis]|uniref:putative quinol monooxygenase n=1 Tax=Levilactobacillus parabrevis TaxID=357278 RepID=UPI00375758A1
MANQATPLFRLFKLTITAEQRANFVTAGRHNLVTSIQNEPGTLAMYTLHVAPAGLENRVIEVYRDAASYDQHANSPQFKAFRAVAKDAVTQQAVVNLMPIVLREQAQLLLVSGEPHFVQLTEVTLKPGQAAAYQELITTSGSAATTVQPSRLVVAIGRVVDDPQKWVIFEVYQDKLAYQRYQQTAANRYCQLTSQASIQTAQTTVLSPDTLVNQGGLTLVDRQG